MRTYPYVGVIGYQGDDSIRATRSGLVSLIVFQGEGDISLTLSGRPCGMTAFGSGVGRPNSIYIIHMPGVRKPSECTHLLLIR